MKIAVVQFPGSNCERETILAIKRANMEPVEFLWNESRDKLRGMDGFVIVGGFSYEDRSRAGIIAALDPVMQEITVQAESGKPVLGICNGAQILVETGLVPGLENNKVAMVLTDNKREANGKILGTGFYNAWVYMRLADDYQRNAFTKHLSSKDILHIPVAHGEGRFVIPPAMLQEMMMNGLHVFQYCDEGGVIDDNFPINPNGSAINIAAVSNKAGNVMAMMPHPERTAAGDPIFASMRDYISNGKFIPVAPLSYYPRQLKLTDYHPATQAEECIVELMITDNQALTVQNTLRQLGLPVTVKRYTHWEITGDAAAIKLAKDSGVLFNPRKETVIDTTSIMESVISEENNVIEMSLETTRETALESTSFFPAYQMASRAGGRSPCLEDRLAQGCASRSQERLRLTNRRAVHQLLSEAASSTQAAFNTTKSVTLLIRPKENILGQQKLQTLKDHVNLDTLTSLTHSIIWHITSDGDIQDLATRIINTNILANPAAHDCYYY